MYTILMTTLEGVPCGMLLHEGKLVEIRFAREEHQATPGDIHVGRVKDVVQGLGAAFLEVGLERTGMLPLKMSGGRKLDLKPGQRLLVRIVRDSSGDKGARLSTELSLPGLGMVLYPGLNRLTFSKKIRDEGNRKRLQELLSDGAGNGMGVLVRTAAVHMADAQLTAELAVLQERWSTIESDFERDPVPRRVCAVSSLARQVEREWLSKPVSQVWVEDPSMKAEMTAVLEQAWVPESIELHEAPDNRSLRRYFKLGKSLDRMRYSKLWLPSGGSVVIDVTEAMTVVDVNSGKYGSKTRHKSTALKINQEACRVIAEQVRLRGTVGIIVVDFIDMEDPGERESLHRQMEKLLQQDPARTRVLPLTQIGLMQITRQRTGVGGGLKEAILCPVCHGTGKKERFAGVMESLADDVWSALHGANRSIREVQIVARPDVGRQIRASGIVEQLDSQTEYSLRLLDDEPLDGKLYQVRVV